MRYLIPVLAVACLSLGACATTEEEVSVPHTVSVVAPTPGAERVRVTVSSIDGRQSNRGRISTKMNGYGMEMAAIRSKEDVAAVVNGAVTAELQARGYRLEAGGAAINVTVETFYNQFSMGLVSGGASANVTLAFTVAGPDGATLYSRRIAATGKKADIQLFSGANAAGALAKGLDHALQTLFEDPAFTEALKHAGAAR